MKNDHTNSYMRYKEVEAFNFHPKYSLEIVGQSPWATYEQREALKKAMYALIEFPCSRRYGWSLDDSRFPGIGPWTPQQQADHDAVVALQQEVRRCEEGFKAGKALDRPDPIGFGFHH